MSAMQYIVSVIGIVISAVVGFGVWGLQRRVDHAENKRVEQDKAREKSQVLLIESSAAAIALGEAAAIALKNGKCNGETERALKYAQDVKHKQKEFLYEQGVRAMWGDT